MFLTAMAGNPLAQNLAEKTAHVHVTWMNWFLAAIVPGIVSLIVIPFIIYKMYPPTVKETPDAKDWAENELADMGSIAKAEKFMIGVFIIALLLWVVGSFIGVDATLTAFIALSLLLITGVLDWKDILNETGAWNTLVWFSVLVMMADQLNQLGFIPWLSHTIANSLGGLSWPVVLVILIIFYFYSHYLFASSTAHVSAMYAALLGVAVAAGAPLFSALMLGFFGNLMASTTHYSSGPAPILYAAGYVTPETLVADEPSLRRCVLCNLARFRFLMDEIDRFDVIILRRETVNSVSLLFVLYSFIFISSLVNTIEQIKTFTYISFLLPNILIRIIIYKNIIL